MEYLYLNIHTGACWTSTRNDRAESKDRKKNDWEVPGFGLTVYSRSPEEGNRIHLSFYSPPSKLDLMGPGWLLVSQEHRDRFRCVRGSYCIFYQPIDRSVPLLTFGVIEPLDGTRMPEPGETLDIIPEGPNAKLPW